MNADIICWRKIKGVAFLIILDLKVKRKQIIPLQTMFKVIQNIYFRL